MSEVIGLARDLILERERLQRKFPHLDMPFCAKLALNRYRILDDELIRLVSEDTCYRWGQRVVCRPEFR